METTTKKPRVFSAVQPSGMPTIGNYIGALKNWVKMQEQFECIYAVADLHAITVRQEPAKLRANSMQMMALLLACGIDTEKSILFMQSHVGAHSELAWLLNCITYLGELSRMTQFKDKSQKHQTNINAGLLDYPVLMAADILLYQAEFVPVGKDQSQHLELTRNIAERFNNAYSPTFVVPEGYIPESGGRVMSLQDPTKKMSKSDDANAYIGLLDSNDEIVRKIKRAVTDSLGEIRYSEEQPGISNLLDIYAAFGDETPQEAAAQFEGKGYGELKNALAERLVESLTPIRERCGQYLKDKAYLQEVMKNGEEAASKIAYRTLAKVRRKMGFI
ncbi:MAG: tryptophan--tRNA ligase [Clostridia bacterium]|nr:tryptophan--tRNA ligase [Clostridia bacterium]